MRALISGQAGVAVLCDEKPLFAVAFDAPGEKLDCATWAEARALFAGADDVIDLPNTTREAVVEELDLAWARDRAMQLTLVLLDGTAKADTRAEAAECVGELFAEPIAERTGEVEAFVANRLYSAPLPVGASDLPRAIVIAKTADPTGTVAALLHSLELAQPRIAKLCSAWEDLQLSLFGDAKGAEGEEKLRGEKARMKSVLIATGAFRKLAEVQGTATLKAVQECVALGGEWDVPRAIVMKWAQVLLSPSTTVSGIQIDDKEENHGRRDRQSGKDRRHRETKEKGYAGDLQKRAICETTTLKLLGDVPLTFAWSPSGTFHEIERINPRDLLAQNQRTKASPRIEASIFSMEGETALYGADTTLAREKHTKAAKILQRDASGARKSAERHLRRFLAATQYYKAGLYTRALRLVRRIEVRLLPDYVKHLFPTLCNQARQRCAPTYVQSVVERVVRCQQKDEYQQVATLLWHHPYVYHRTGVAFMRAYTSIQLKDYYTAGAFAEAAYRFGLNTPARIMELAFLPYQVYIKEGPQAGWQAAQSFTKAFPHAMTYLVASAILYQLALSTKGDERWGWASKQVDYYNKAITSCTNPTDIFLMDSELKSYALVNAATASIANAWLGDLASALIVLDAAERANPGNRLSQTIISDVRNFVKSLGGPDFLNTDPPIIPIESIVKEIGNRWKEAMERQAVETAA